VKTRPNSESLLPNPASRSGLLRPRRESRTVTKYLSIPMRIHWLPIVIIMSIQTPIATECCFISKQDIPKKFWILF